MINSTLCYIMRDGCLLMLHRTKKKNDPNGGKWIGVGGRLEEGESPDRCLVREVREETGFILESYSMRGVVTFVSDVYGTEQMFLYTADRFSGTLRECDEGELQWVPLDRLFSLNMWQGDRLFLEKTLKGDGFFTMRLEYAGDTLVGTETG
ncbi:MAG: 8-oxo-dGTP diphosphatase [Clostridia bacterium]|nr:8-oxo-dGTP diphosphatase [Clostridia bacterium]